MRLMTVHRSAPLTSAASPKVTVLRVSLPRLPNSQLNGQFTSRFCCSMLPLIACPPGPSTISLPPRCP